MQTTIIDGIAAFSLIRGEDAPNVLILHGALGSSEKLMYLAGIFDRENLYFADLRGHGRSLLTVEGYDLESLANDLVAPLRAILPVAPLAIIGESIGGWIALKLANRLERPIRRIFLLDTPLQVERTLPSHWMLWASYRKMKEGAAKHAMRQICRQIYGLDVDTGDVLPTEYYALLTPELAAISTMITGSIKLAGVERYAIASPPAYFDGEDLRMLAQQGITGLEVRTIEGAGHNILKTHAAVCRSMLLEYFY